MKTCYVIFKANPDQLYAYHSGALEPEINQLVVVLVGKDKSHKIVQCVKTSDEVDPKATAQIFGLVQEQPLP